MILQVQDLRFAWPGSSAPCLDIAHLELPAGRTLFIHGPSGCGKSTLLSLMAGVLLPTSGRVLLLGKHWGDVRASARDALRAAHVGYVFQQFNLVPWLDALDNVLLPCHFSERRRARALTQSGSLRAAAQHWLDCMGLQEGARRRAARQLSVGQQQRVAAARALIGTPELVIADEPTSALDEDLRERFLDALLGACARAGSSLVLVSHDRRMASRFDAQQAFADIQRARGLETPA